MTVQKVLSVSSDVVARGGLGVLGKPADRVTSFDGTLDLLVQNLLETMHTFEYCVGLAAPQVAVSARVAVIRARVLDEDNPIVLVNPVVIAKRGKKDGKTEVCMSLPGWGGLVRRKLDIDVSYQDQDGKLLERSISGFAARVFQHEIDHLDGLLYVTHLRDGDELIKVEPRPT